MLLGRILGELDNSLDITNKKGSTFKALPFCFVKTYFSLTDMINRKAAIAF